MQISAPARDGEANEALLEFMSDVSYSSRLQLHPDFLSRRVYAR